LPVCSTFNNSLLKTPPSAYKYPPYSIGGNKPGMADVEDYIVIVKRHINGEAET